MDAGTISISIGDARYSTCLVLPRGHELVRHLQSLLPANTVSPLFSQEISPPPPPTYATPPPVPPSRPMRPSPHHDRHRSAAVIQALLNRPIATPSTNGTVVGRRPYPTGRAISQTLASGRKKPCQIHNCGKISVSQGLCRAHGGGRRCQVEGCTKSAQSRGDVCWSHGGGHRCEVPGCMRSRKSKRFCNLHLHSGSEKSFSRPPHRTLAAAHTEPESLPTETFSTGTTSGPPRLPSLLQALHQQHPREPSPALDFSHQWQHGSLPSFSC